MMDSSGGAFLRFIRRFARSEGKAGEPLQAEPSGDAPVVVCNLTKTFLDESRGTIRAVDGISFECRESEVFGLLGANGAGKTTTLRMLSTIIAPTSGTAKSWDTTSSRTPPEFGGAWDSIPRAPHSIRA